MIYILSSMIKMKIKCNLKTGYKEEGSRSIDPAFVKTFTGLVESIEMCPEIVHFTNFKSCAS